METKKKYRFAVRATVLENKKEVKKFIVYPANTYEEAEDIFSKKFKVISSIVSSKIENAHIDHYLNIETRL